MRHTTSAEPSLLMRGFCRTRLSCCHLGVCRQSGLTREALIGAVPTSPRRALRPKPALRQEVLLLCLNLLNVRCPHIHRDTIATPVAMIARATIRA
eukprot:1813088-Prymnesium_polylepis.1